MVGLVILLGIALGLLAAILTGVMAWEMRHPPRHTAGYATVRGLACDPGELGLAFEEWTLERPNGVRLPVWEIVNPQSSMGNPLTAVFVHGWGHSRIDALTRFAAFGQKCDRVMFFDLRGHGEATGTSRLGDGEDDDLIALLERLGDGRFVLVGHSMGAVAAMQAACSESTMEDDRGTHPLAPSLKGGGIGARISGVIAYGPYLDFHRSLCGRLRGAGWPSRPITDLAMLTHRVMGMKPRSLGLDDVRNVECPLLLIHGSEDRVAPIADARLMASAARKGMLIEIAGADHLNAHEVDRARHDDAVRGFLARVGSL